MLLSDILIVLLIVVFIGLVFWAVPTSYFILFTVLAVCTIVFLFLVEKLLTLKEKVIYAIKSLHLSNKLFYIKQCVENYISQWSGAFLYSHWVKNKFVNFLLNLIVYGIFWSLILYLMIAVDTIFDDCCCISSSSRSFILYCYYCYFYDFRICTTFYS